MLYHGATSLAPGEALCGLSTLLFTQFIISVYLTSFPSTVLAVRAASDSTLSLCHSIGWKKLETSVQFSVKTTSFYISHGWQSNWFFPFSTNCVSFLHRRPGFASAGLEWLPKRKSLLPTSDERALGGMNVRREALRTGRISVQGMMQMVRWWCVETGFNCSRLSL